MKQYSAIIFILGRSRPFKLRKVMYPQRLVVWLNRNHPNWMYFNLYDRTTKEFKTRWKNGNFYPSKIR
jgi:hypothetical protein